VEYCRVSNRFGVVFDDESLVADAGLLTAGTLVDRLGLEQLVDGTVWISFGRVSTSRVLPFRVMAPSTVGTCP